MQKPHILTVEDDLDLSEMLTAFLRAHHYDVQATAWGRDALTMIENQSFDLLILDIRLPDIDGYEICRQVRAQRRTRDIPIIFLTEKSDRADKLHGLELGVHDYITKPFDIQEIRLRVRNILARSERQSMTNLVTGLPQDELVDEMLADMLSRGNDWAAISAVIEGIPTFREHYGFLATDDMLRAMTLIVRNAVREFVGDTEQIGHLSGAETFIIAAPPDKASAIQERITERINQSREFFFPAKDRAVMLNEKNSRMLRMKTVLVTPQTGAFEDIDALRTALLPHETKPAL